MNKENLNMLVAGATFILGAFFGLSQPGTITGNVIGVGAGGSEGMFTGLVLIIASSALFMLTMSRGNNGHGDNMDTLTKDHDINSVGNPPIKEYEGMSPQERIELLKNSNSPFNKWSIITDDLKKLGREELAEKIGQYMNQYLQLKKKGPNKFEVDVMYLKNKAANIIIDDLVKPFADINTQITELAKERDSKIKDLEIKNAFHNEKRKDTYNKEEYQYDWGKNKGIVIKDETKKVPILKTIQYYPSDDETPYYTKEEISVSALSPKTLEKLKNKIIDAYDGKILKLIDQREKAENRLEKQVTKLLDQREDTYKNRQFKKEEYKLITHAIRQAEYELKNKKET